MPKLVPYRSGNTYESEPIARSLEPFIQHTRLAGRHEYFRVLKDFAKPALERLGKAHGCRACSSTNILIGLFSAATITVRRLGQIRMGTPVRYIPLQCSRYNVAFGLVAQNKRSCGPSKLPVELSLKRVRLKVFPTQHG